MPVRRKSKPRISISLPDFLELTNGGKFEIRTSALNEGTFFWTQIQFTLFNPSYPFDFRDQDLATWKLYVVFKQFQILKLSLKGKYVYNNKK